jgi:TolA-binding protein
MHPLWLKISYHPDWRVTTGVCEVYLASPSFMLLVPHTPRVVLTFDTRSGIYAVGMILTLAAWLCVLGAALLSRLHDAAGSRGHHFPQSGNAGTPGLFYTDQMAARTAESLPFLRWWVWVFMAAALAFALVNRSGRDPILLYTKAVNIYEEALSMESGKPGQDRQSSKSIKEAQTLNRKAEDLFTLCLEKFPYSPVVDHSIHYLTVLLQKDGRWKESEELLASFIARYPDTRSLPECLYHLGLCSRHTARGKTSNDYFWQVLVSSPEDPWAKHAAYRLLESTMPEELLAIAKNYYYDNDIGRAGLLLEAMADRGPPAFKAESGFLYASSSYYQSNWKEASRLLSEWLRHFPSHPSAPEAWFKLSETQAYMQDYAAAASSLREALTRDPSFRTRQPYAAFVETLDSLSNPSKGDSTLQE